MARNKVESSKIEAPVKLCAEMDDEPKVQALAKGLLEDWESLEFGYRIPRALKVRFPFPLHSLSTGVVLTRDATS